MIETGAHLRPRATYALPVGRRSPAARAALLIAASCGGLAVALVGWFLGAAPLTAVEPGGKFVDCGPALFDRPDPLPDAQCAGAYFPLPAASVLSIAAGVMAVVLCVGILVRGVTSRSQAEQRPTREARRPSADG